MKKLMDIKVPPIAGVSNWVAVDSVQVIRGHKAWLVINIDAGQDNVHPDSVAYSAPKVEEWTNRSYEPMRLTFTYKFNHWLYNGRELVAELIDIVNGTEIYVLHSYGCGLITPKVTIYLEGIEVPKIVLPKIPTVKGVDGLYFYNEEETK